MPQATNEHSHPVRIPCPVCVFFPTRALAQSGATVDKRIESVSDLVKEVDARAQSQEPLWYRGLTKASHRLVPTIARNPHTVDQELGLLNIFKQNAAEFVVDRPQSEWEWLFLARHHSVPTRLMDWTESPLIGLYFAVTSTDVPEKNDRFNGVLWLLRPLELNRYGNIPQTHPRDLPIFEDDNPDLINYLPSHLGSESKSDIPPVAGLAARHSKRMQAQHSVFTVMHRTPTPLEDVGQRNHVDRYIIPRRAKREIRAQLNRLKIDRLSVFPELDNAGFMARRLYGE